MVQNKYKECAKNLVKYGRILADIYLDGLNVNQYIVNNNYAYVYSGGKTGFRVKDDMTTRTKCLLNIYICNERYRKFDG